MRRFLECLCAVALSATVGCKPEKPATETPTGVVSGPAAPTTDGKVVARIGDRSITLAEFEQRLNQQSPFARSRYNSLQRKKEFLDSLVRFELLALDAQKKGFDKDPDVQLALKQAMVKKLTGEEIRDLVKLTDITDADVEKHYNENLGEFDKPAEVRASHIRVADEATARKVLAELLPQIQADPRRARQVFADFVRLHSNDEPTKRMGGDLQFFGAPGETRVVRTPDQPVVPAPVVVVANQLDKVGEVHPEPVQSEQGWHIVQKTGFRRPYKRTLEDVKTSIRNKLFRVRKGQAMEAYVQSLRDGAKVEIDEAVVNEAKIEPVEGLRPDIAPPFMRGPGMGELPGELPGLELPPEPGDPLDTHGGDVPPEGTP
jgi:peptidyl-prolyl cis-trans isomerase C